MFYRKTLLLSLIAASVFFFAACGGDESSSGNDGDSDAEESAVDGDESSDGDVEIDGDAAEQGEQLEETDGDTESEEPYFDDPRAAGKYHVGATKITVNYEDPDVAGRMRELPCVVWYPTMDEEGDNFLVDDWWERDGIFDTAAPYLGDAPYPMIAFSHGNSGLAEQSWTLMEYMASHGFVLVSCNHVGNTAGDWQQDGKEKVPQSVHDRPYDVRFMVETMVERNSTAGDMFEGLIDPERIGASGHSLGGFTTLVASGAELHFQQYAAQCEADPSKNFCEYLEVDCSVVKDGRFPCERIKAAVAFAPAGYGFFDGATGLSKIEIPTLIMGGDRDGTCPMDSEIIPIYQALAVEEKVLVTCINTGHMSFSNICNLVGPINDYLKQEGCGEGFSTQDEVFDVMGHYSLAFFRRYLDGDTRYDQYLSADDPSRWSLKATVETPGASE